MKKIIYTQRLIILFFVLMMNFSCIEHEDDLGLFIEDYLVLNENQLLIGTSDGIISYNISTDSFKFVLDSTYIISLLNIPECGKYFAGTVGDIYYLNKRDSSWDKTPFSEQLIDAWGVTLNYNNDVLYAATSAGLFFKTMKDFVWHSNLEIHGVKLFAFSLDSIAYFANLRGNIICSKV